MLTQQEVFDKVTNHLRTQNVRATVGGLCVYRTRRVGSDGDRTLKCAVGVFIPDEMYNRKMEGNDITELLVRFPDLWSVFDGNNLELLTNLQGVHDSDNSWSYPNGEWSEKGELRLQQIAHTYNLVYTEPSE